MDFKKDVLFLGDSVMTFKDGKVMHQVEFFVPGSGSVKINLFDDDKCMAIIKGLVFGDKLECTFVLRPYDKAYKLGLVQVLKLGK